LSRPEAAEPEEDESPKVGPFGDSTPVEARRFRRRTGRLVHYVEDGEPPPRSHEIEELNYRRPRRSLFVGGALLAVVLAAGLTYVMIQSENPVAMPPTDAADPAKIVPAATPADTDDKMAAAPAPSGDASNPISRVVEPTGVGSDPLAKAGDAPASADHPATDVATGGDDAGGEQPSSLGRRPAGRRGYATNRKSPVWLALPAMSVAQSLRPCKSGAGPNVAAIRIVPDQRGADSGERRDLG
jgi:hypothetical protein